MVPGRNHTYKCQKIPSLVKYKVVMAAYSAALLMSIARAASRALRSRHFHRQGEVAAAASYDQAQPPAAALVVVVADFPRLVGD